MTKNLSNTRGKCIRPNCKAKARKGLWCNSHHVQGLKRQKKITQGMIIHPIKVNTMVISDITSWCALEVYPYSKEEILIQVIAHLEDITLGKN